MLAPLLRKTWVLLVVACSVGMPLGALIAEPTRNVALSGPPHVSEDARFPSENGALLAGTLEKPDWTGPFPVAVIISGTGPWTRGSSWDFELVRARLLAKGIATFRYGEHSQAL